MVYAAGGSEAGAKKLGTPDVAAVMDIELTADKTAALITVGRKVSACHVVLYDVRWCHVT